MFNFFAKEYNTFSTEMQDEDFIITEVQNNYFITELIFEEFSQTVKQMHPDKASDLNDLNPNFFQHFWSLMGEEVFKFCRTWLHECSFLADVNDTNVVLIPQERECRQHEGPASHCTV